MSHGSGSADPETADAAGRLRVPPAHPAYTLRRVWLNKGDEEDYYNGFSNQSLWPLCHIVYERPIFRAQDWQAYQRVNGQFAAAVLDEAAGHDAIVLIQDYPIVTQVSRFDRLKDPVGVVEAFRQARKYTPCRLVLAGGSASDDPEGAEVLADVREAADNDPDIHVLELPPTANVEINALQRASTVIVQKSLKVGFGLTVSEALWKGKPVIAGAVGGIPLQISHRYSGILTHTVEGTAFWIKQLLNAPEYARRLGENGREHVRNNFLLTRHLRDYLLLFLFLEYRAERIVTLQ